MKHLFTLFFATAMLSAQAQLTVNFSPQFDIICGEQPCVQYVDYTTAAVSWQWNFGDPASGPANTSTQQNPMHCFSGLGTFTVTLTVMNASSNTATGTGTITVTPTPVALFTSTNTGGNTVQFTDQSAPNVVAWQWNFGDASPVSTVQNPTHTYAASGTYNVSLIAVSNYGCTDTSYMQVTATPTGIESSGNLQLVSCFPNPAANAVTINLPSASPSVVEIFNAAGELLLRDEETGDRLSVDVSSLPAGVFLLHVQQGEDHLRQQLVILR